MKKENKDKKKVENIIKNIEEKKFKILKKLKDDNRSLVYLIEIDNKKFVYKVPIEKNKRVWQRILSVFRGSESFREYKNYLRVLELGFKGPKPVCYKEIKKYGVVIDSFLVTEFLEAKTATVEDIELVGKELSKIHRKGYLHGDSQLSNFMIKDNNIYIIDAKLNRNIYFKAGEKYEYIYLEESCYKEIKIYDKIGYSYKMAKCLNRYLHFWGKFKKKLRRKES